MSNQIDDLCDALKSITEQFFSQRLLVECENYDIAVSRLYQGVCAYLANTILNTSGEEATQMNQMVAEYTLELINMAQRGDVINSPYARQVAT